MSARTESATTQNLSRPSDGPSNRSRRPLALGTSLAAVTVLALSVGSLTGAQASSPSAPPSRATSILMSTTPLAGPAPWRLAWEDNFDGTALNRNVWNVAHRSTYGDGNKELACLMDRPENVAISGGILTIAALKEATPIKCGNSDSRFPAGRAYTSAMLHTKNKLSFQYGRFEIRAKMPTTQGTSKGLWPAYWMRPAAGGIGEIDILELVGTGKKDAYSANKVTQTIHYDYVKTYPQQERQYKLPAGNFADGFHDYAVEWAPGSLKWYVDGVLTYTRDTSTTPWLDTAFTGTFYLRLNMAVGGTWPGSPDANTAFPAKYQIDYVKVYQR